jgi:hypothetical protein
MRTRRTGRGVERGGRGRSMKNRMRKGDEKVGIKEEEEDIKGE